MKVRQSATFAIRSAAVTADDVTKSLGLTPDDVRVKGSRSRTHAWILVSRAGSWSASRTDVWDESRVTTAHVEDLYARLAGISSQIRRLVELEGVEASLGVVRWYFPMADEAQLNIHLDRRVLRFLADARASFYVAEYDMSLAPEVEVAAARSETWTG